MDVGRLLEVLEQEQYAGWYVLEQDILVENEPPEGEGPINDVRKSIMFLERQLKEPAESERKQ